MKNDILKENKQTLVYFAKWVILSVATGIILGILGGLFGRSITILTAFRVSHPWMLYLLPVAGLVIVAMYKTDPYHTSTNLILEGIHSGKFVPLRTAPLIVGSTILTHAFGGSAGREGAALQLGGSIGGTLGKYLKLDKEDSTIMLMCGMSAAFSALFGTPLTAAIFSMEVVSIGIMHYSALLPCALSSLIAHAVACLVGSEGEAFTIAELPVFDIKGSVAIVILALLCSILSVLFCLVLHRSEHLFEHYIKNPWLRVVFGGVMVILLAKLLNTTDYLGAGMNIVEKALEGEVSKPAFFLKIVFTAFTLGCGYKGGEIVPTLFVGATFGCLFGTLVGFSPSLCAACGMVSMFCGVTNCPISSLLLGFEMCGFEAMPFYLVSVAIAYMGSGPYGLYHSQRLMYSKTKLKFVNKTTK